MLQIHGAPVAVSPRRQAVQLQDVAVLRHRLVNLHLTHKYFSETDTLSETENILSDTESKKDKNNIVKGRRKEHSFKDTEPETGTGQKIFWNEFADLISSILYELGDLHLDPCDPVLHLCLELPQEEPRPGAQVHHSPAGLPPPPPHRAQAPPDQTCQECSTMLCYVQEFQSGSLLVYNNLKSTCALLLPLNDL